MQHGASPLDAGNGPNQGHPCHPPRPRFRFKPPQYRKDASALTLKAGPGSLKDKLAEEFLAKAEEQAARLGRDRLSFSELRGLYHGEGGAPADRKTVKGYVDLFEAVGLVKVSQAGRAKWIHLVTLNERCKLRHGLTPAEHAQAKRDARNERRRARYARTRQQAPTGGQKTMRQKDDTGSPLPVSVFQTGHNRPPEPLQRGFNSMVPVTKGYYIKSNNMSDVQKRPARAGMAALGDVAAAILEQAPLHAQAQAKTHSQAPTPTPTPAQEGPPKRPQAEAAPRRHPRDSSSSGAEVVDFAALAKRAQAQCRKRDAENPKAREEAEAYYAKPKTPTRPRPDAVGHCRARERVFTVPVRADTSVRAQVFDVEALLKRDGRWGAAAALSMAQAVVAKGYSLGAVTAAYHGLKPHHRDAALFVSAVQKYECGEWLTRAAPKQTRPTKPMLGAHRNQALIQ